MKGIPIFFKALHPLLEKKNCFKNHLFSKDVVGSAGGDEAD